MNFGNTSLTALYNMVGYNFEQTTAKLITLLPNAGSYVRTAIGEDNEDRPLKFSELYRASEGFYLSYGRDMVSFYSQEKTQLPEDAYFTVDELAEMFNSPFLKDRTARRDGDRNSVVMGPLTSQKAADLMKFFIFKNLAAEAENVAARAAMKYQDQKPATGGAAPAAKL